MPVNRRQGDTFWKLLGEAGKKVRVMRMPVTFPPEHYDHGEMLSGLGTPDLSFRIGKPFYFTSELFFQPKGGNEISIEIVELIDNKGVIDTEIKGPPNKLFPGQSEYITIPMRITVAEDKSKLDIEVSGGKVSLEPGKWSPWVRFVFPFNPLIKLSGVGRFRVLSIAPEVRLYLSPIQFDPEHLPPVVDVTAPRSFAGDLVRRFGLFKTIGWMIDTWSIKGGTIDDDVFHEDVEMTVAQDEKMVQGLLADDWDVYFHYFEFTDRVQHVMWHHIDPQHPLYTAEGAAKHGDAIFKAYLRMDEIVGKVRETMPKDALLFVVSDHGFQPWRRTMNYNTWLAKEGYLVLKGESEQRANLEDLFDQGQFFQDVDWSKTRAYAMGLGNIYINLKGREGEGIVEPGEPYQALVAEIKRRLPEVRRRGDRRAPGRLRLHPRRGLRHLRPAAHPGHVPLELRGLPGGLAGHARHRGQAGRRAEPRRLERRPLFGLPAAGRRRPLLQPEARAGGQALHGRPRADPARALRREVAGRARRQEPQRPVAAAGRRSAGRGARG